MHTTIEELVSKQRIGCKRCFIYGPCKVVILRESVENWSRELSSANIIEKIWQQDTCQLYKRIGLRVPELTDDERVKRVQLRVESPAVKRSLYMCRSTVIF
jgi:hypothetical protein